MRPLVVAALLVSACGGAGSNDETPDAGPDGGEMGPEEPAPPAMPVLTPCPKGWRSVPDAELADVVTCEPWPGTGREPCEGVEAHFPGEKGCRRIGTECPAGDWPEGLPVDADVVYVRAGAVGGDGSQSAPFGEIADGVAAAQSGDIVAIAKGTYDEYVQVWEPITLWGACVAETIVASSTPNDLLWTITIRGAGGTTVKNLQVSGALGGFEVIGADALVTIDSVLVEGTSPIGLFVWQDSEVEAQDLIVRQTRGRDLDGNFGQGLGAELGGRLTVTRGVVEASRGAGAFIADPGTVFVLRDSVIADTQPQEATGLYGVGLDVMGGASAQIERVVLEGNRGLGLASRLPGSTLVATDVVVRDTLPQETDDTGGGGVQVSAGGSATFERALVERNRYVGVAVGEVGSSIVATDLVVRDTQSRLSDGGFGDGIEVGDGARMEVERGVVVRNQEGGILIGHEGTVFVATDLFVADQRPRSIDGHLGFGFLGGLGSRAELTRALFERNRYIGVLVEDPVTTLVAEDLVVRDMQGSAGRCDVGIGIAIALGATADVTRAHVQRARAVGVIAVATGAHGTFEDLSVTETLDWGQNDPECEGTLTGSGLVSVDGSMIEVSDFVIADSAFCGVQLARGGEIDLHRGEVTTNLVGANVQTEDFDVDRLRDEVVYVDNERTLDTTALPIPEVVTDVR